MVFCNMIMITYIINLCLVTILILIDGFLQYELIKFKKARTGVTILILIDGFLQYDNQRFWEKVKRGHNPYFNRWFSAIVLMGKY